ncbi:hypothetical protein [Streptacidiphilus fuscans]|uniref:Uncharacterized protein n=1 Tax=Streptacidiphilus fuscans TaxID=2789292 RepID=A0A931BAC0_9ACTN|nr:hypothetical protein [Streptacidiphilus fuscans]MBF9073048.1 hypothetical protein [Streptacidiphilus fuscans]
MPQTEAHEAYEEPRSARLVAWGNAWFAGLTSPDDAAEAVRGSDETHLVRGLPGADGVGLTLALGRLRTLGATGLRLALPAAGHPLGLTGPAEFNARALETGEAVVAVDAPWGLVPEALWHGADHEDDGVLAVTWHALPVVPGFPADVPALRDAERELLEGMREATESLVRLDVAGAGPAVQTALARMRTRAEEAEELLAPGYSARAVRVLQSARRVAALVAVAALSEGAAVSAGEMAARADALRPLERAARRARVAAYNSLVDEPAADRR